jgi:hypothetical protein
MADNFDLRQFLTENKLTKNTQLLNEGSDISGYWVMYGEPNKGIQQFIKMFPSEEEAQQALQNAPKTYGAHVLRSNWGIQSAQDWLASGKELGPDNLGHPDRVPPKRLSPEELKAIRQLDFDAEMEREGVEEGVDEAKGYSFTLTYNDAEYVQQVLDNAGVDAVAKAGTFDDEIIVRAFDGMGLRRAKQALEADHFDISENVNEAKSYKVSKNSKEAQHLKKGDIIGSGDEVVSVSAGAKTPKGKVEVTLKTKDGKTKTSTWGKYTKIGVKEKETETVKENKMTQRDKYLTRLVENALGLDPDYMEDYPEEKELQKRIDRNIDQAMYRGEAERERDLEEGDEMVNEKPLPKYENIEKLMQEIDKSTDEEAHKFKMQEMKRVADMLEKKCTALEEGDDADHIDQKKLKQMKKDIMTLRKGIEKMEKLGEKKFTKKETKADLKEGFDLRKFLVENKLTTNSKAVKEEKALDMSREAAQALQDAYENIKKVYATFGNDSRFNDVADKADERMILDILELINNKLKGYSNNMGYGSGAKLGY